MGELSNGFAKVIEDLKIGLTLEEGLDDLSKKVPSIYLQNIILDLKENSRYGTKVTDSIEWQLSAMEQHYQENIIGNRKMLPIK